MSDPHVERTRAEITAVDRELLEAINRRLQIVRRLHDYKVANGIPLRDPGREESMTAALEQANLGPLTSAGVAEFFQHVLDLTRKELHGEE